MSPAPPQQLLIAASGRVLDYQVLGDPSWIPLIWIHGTPNSYLAIASLAKACAERKIRLVTFSRAGYGGSTRNPGRRIVDEVADVAALRDHVAADRTDKKCFVAGWSGGGAPSLACAAHLDECLAVLCVAGTAPKAAEGLDWLAGQGEDNVQEFIAASKGEDSLRAFLEPQRQGLLAADAESMIQELSTLLPDVDRTAMGKSDLGETVVAGLHEGLKLGVDGWVDDDLALIGDWGFELADVRCPVVLYQGSEDKMVPFAHGQWLARHLPEKYLTAHFMQGQGHISILVGRFGDLLDELLSFSKGC